MRKIGLLTMALVLALGSLGIAYAAWTDEITIEGSVTTGSVELEVVAYSGTEAWKVDEHGIEVLTGWLPLGDPVGVPVLPEPIGWAAARTGDDDDEADVVFEFDHLFPGVEFCADILVHYIGSVPAYVSVDVDTEEPWLMDLWESGYAVVNFYRSDADGERGDALDVDEPLQMHYCDYVIVEICVEIPQDNDLQGLTGSFSGSINAIQWSECDDDENGVEPGNGHESAWAEGESYNADIAMYVTYGGEPLTVSLIAGTDTHVGWVHFSAPSDGFVTITVTLLDGWLFSTYNGENVYIQDYQEAPSGTPASGLFAYKYTAMSSPWASPSDEIPENNYYGVHVNVMEA